jgi:two-component system chemotaxis sensor kinase CheA
MVEFDRSAFIGKFQEEAGEYLQRLNEGVITLEGDPGNRELIDQMLRDAHTLKGSSRMVGLIEISDVAHRLEDIMVKVRDGQMVYTPDMSDMFFEALDMIVFLSENAGKELPETADVQGLTRGPSRSPRPLRLRPSGLPRPPTRRPRTMGKRRKSALTASRCAPNATRRSKSKSRPPSACARSNWMRCSTW